MFDFLVIFWMFFGTCLNIVESVWKLLESFGTILGVFWDILGTCLENVGKFWEHVWDNLGRLVGKNGLIYFRQLTNISVPEICVN